MIITKHLISVIGPTAIGKTALAIKLAQYFNTEIISADSRQFFKEMRIGTAVPSAEELKSANHHFIQHISIFDEYSVGDFEKDALKKLEDLFKVHDTVIMVGGSGLYVDAVLKGLDHFPEVDPQIREELQKDLEENGIEHLQKRLKELDKSYYEKVDLQNPHRLIRALEICIGSGRPYSSFLKNTSKERPFTAVKVGLTAERPIIYDRINRRVDIMIKEGLLEEAKALYPHKELNALQTVGYKELFQYFEGTWSEEFAVEEIKKNTRRFAKRQLTWYRKNPEVLWFDFEAPFDKIIAGIEEKIS
ncbi:tRNA (adenosine(37)-N6)-dimethylallyltransferase MiaA [Leptobacterium flavescens]|uniref:tRNA dimethylallyltransferase n=1 Tax=Leptobacterium flavescens TaxID=472055 RepID=A0A6P0ULN3_9FLAO|nr:tRNA (adenosine(37)-N6)-dimethylallyltransferase MiaA [Leptobacterium flavescens]NER13320.1 tRNA (adenosine(37)-N6)-dimethylallyltransferase MiaA [Leptobacterium flavescens]